MKSVIPVLIIVAAAVGCARKVLPVAAIPMADERAFEQQNGISIGDVRTLQSLDLEIARGVAVACQDFVLSSSGEKLELDVVRAAANGKLYYLHFRVLNAKDASIVYVFDRSQNKVVCQLVHLK